MQVLPTYFGYFYVEITTEYLSCVCLRAVDFQWHNSHCKRKRSRAEVQRVQCEQDLVVHSHMR